MTNYPAISFNRAAVEPIECLKNGFETAKTHYWLFVGITTVGMLIASVVPFGLLMGPMMCGIYLAYFKVRRGESVEFGDLFKGFDYFGQSLIATLIHIIPIMIVFVPSYLAFYISLFLMMPRQGGEPDPAAMLTFFGVFAIFWFVIIVFVMVISILFTFTYPLIVDRGLSGLDSVKLSARAALGNFWRLLGLFLINGVLGMVGMLLCYVGVVLVLPITFGALISAYERVFGLGGPQPSNLPPPPPTFS
jgi:uncharacterized membrane protein